jgi:hypothetical protein
LADGVETPWNPLLRVQMVLPLLPSCHGEVVTE